MRWDNGKQGGKCPRSRWRRPYLVAKEGSPRGGQRVGTVPWLAMPCCPQPECVKPGCAGGCLQGARHCPQRNHFFKSLGPRPEPEGNGWVWASRGASLGLRDISSSGWEARTWWQWSCCVSLPGRGSSCPARGPCPVGQRGCGVGLCLAPEGTGN